MFDDSLSACDPEVANLIFKHCICDLLKDSSRILVTHAVAYLPRVDRVCVMQQGRITHSGTHEELIQDSEIRDLLGADLDQVQPQVNGETVHTEESASVKLTEEHHQSGALWSEERRQSGLEDVSLDLTVEERRQSRVEDVSLDVAVAGEEGKHMVDEERVYGHVTGEVYKYYAKQGGGTLFSFVSIVSCFSHTTS
jgi:ABC-type multidrug transport system ATPase subunit